MTYKEPTTDAPPPLTPAEPVVKYYTFVCESNLTNEYSGYQVIKAENDQEALMIFNEGNRNYVPLVVFETDHFPREVL